MEYLSFLPGVGKLYFGITIVMNNADVFCILHRDGIAILRAISHFALMAGEKKDNAEESGNADNESMVHGDVDKNVPGVPFGKDGNS